MTCNCNQNDSSRNDKYTCHVDPCGDEIASMVKDYRERIYDNYQIWINSLNTITDFVCGEVNAEEAPKPEKYCKNSHQHRLKKKTIDAACDILYNIDFSECKDFGTILALVHQTAGSRVKGFGKLAAFDFAQRYSINHGIFPEVVYLHAGVTDGVKALQKAGFDITILKDPICGEYVEMESLPKPIAELGAFMAENFLCIYKHPIEKVRK